MNTRLMTPWLALRFGIGLTATLAGLDKFLNLLADWGTYLSPLAVQFLPMPVGTFMGLVGVIEVAVGLAILTGWTRVGVSLLKQIAGLRSSYGSSDLYPKLASTRPGSPRCCGQSIPKFYFIKI